MESSPAVTPELLLAARNLAVDALTAEIVGEFESARIPTVVLKGPAIATWLYGDRAVRSYGDTDLLVPPGDWAKAQSVLQGRGFEDGLGPLAHPRMESITSHPWCRGTQEVDLHCTLWGVEVEPGEAWSVLSSHTEPLSVGGREVRVLDPAARAMHVALHAAQHGADEGKHIADLNMALEVLPEELWRDAADRAAQLGALGGFATGLRLSEAGQAIVERLGLGREASVDALLRVAQVPLAHGFEELANAPGWRARLSLVLGELFPTAEFMRWWSPLARHGRLGLAVSYGWRPVYLALHAAPALRAWRRARRMTAS